MKEKRKSRNPNGRDFIKINWKIAENLCEIQCTGEEISGVLGIDYDTLNSAIKREKKLSFSDWRKKHAVNGTSSLRREQFRLAVKDHNPTMLIWLGKQYLGQRDSKTDTNIHIDQGAGKNMNIDVNASPQDAAKIYQDMIRNGKQLN